MKFPSKREMFGIIFIDSLIQLMIILSLILVVVVLQPHLNAKSKEQSKMSLGRICAELSWDNSRDVDLDLWGRSPDDEGRSVGYSRTRGNHLSLFRDVLGFTTNPTHQNQEVMCSVDKIPGLWTFNVHYYANHEGFKDDISKQGIDAIFVIHVYNSENGEGQPWTRGFKVHLERQTQEITIVSFYLDDYGVVEEDTINNRFTPLKGGEEESKDK